MASVLALSVAIPVAADPAIVLVTITGLRADLLEPSVVPGLAEEARAAGWTGTVRASSSDERAAVGTLLTGERPWHHGDYAGGAGRSSAVPTLGERLSRAGRRTRAFVDPNQFGWLAARGFGEVSAMGDGVGAAEALGELADGDFVWVHLSDADLPHRVRSGLSRRLEELGVADAGTGELDLGTLLAAHDSGRRPRPGLVRELRRLHRLELAWTDHKLRGLLGLMRASPAGERAVLIVVGSRGAPLGERGALLPGEGLERGEIEVGAVVRWPSGELDWKRGGAVDARRIAGLIASIADLPRFAGSPAVLDADLPPTASLAELYLGNGVNRFSLIEDSHQAIVTTHFAPPEPEYRAAQRRLAGLSSRLQEGPETILDRLRRRFMAVPPLRGVRGGDLPAAEVRLRRFTADGGSDPLEGADPALAEHLVERLLEEWERGVAWHRAAARRVRPRPGP